MILPASYHTGFAPRDGYPMYPELWRGCVGAWAPCLGPTGLTLRDWSGRQSHAAITTAGLTTAWAISQGRWGYNFNGNDAFASVTRSSRFNSTSIRTISAWINVTSFDGAFGFNDIIGCDVIGGTREWNLACYTSNGNSNDGGFGFTIFRDASNTISTQTASEILATSTWYHIAWTHDGSLTYAGMRLFANGIERATANVSGGTLGTPSVSTTTPLQIGRRFGNGGFDLNFNGFIDDVIIYDRQLSANEIAILATRRGIAYELYRPTYYTPQISARRRKLLTGQV